MEQFKKRLYSFLWRFGSAITVGVIALALSPEFQDALSQDGIRIPATLWLLVSLVLSELTKFLNTTTR